jgi:hypothetical protein
VGSVDAAAFPPGYDACAVPAKNELLVAATVDGHVAIVSERNLPTVATFPDLAVRHIGTLHARPVRAGEFTPIPE